MSDADDFSALVIGGKLKLAGTGMALPWWSFGKTVIAAAMLALVRDGRFELDETIRDRKSTRLNSSHVSESRMPSSA